MNKNSSIINHQSSIIDHQSSIINHQSSIIDHQSSIINHQSSIVLFPGSFDPFTIGHADLVKRALQLFDEVVIAVGVNEQKAGWISADERVRALKELYKEDSRVRVESYSGLTTDFASSIGAAAILRGVRTVKDFEYEQQMADINRRLTGIDTVCLFADPQLAAISSSLVRELAHFGKDITPFLP